VASLSNLYVTLSKVETNVFWSEHIGSDCDFMTRSRTLLRRDWVAVKGKIFLMILPVLMFWNLRTELCLVMKTVKYSLFGVSLTWRLIFPCWTEDCGK